VLRQVKHDSVFQRAGTVEGDPGWLVLRTNYRNPALGQVQRYFVTR
jgi:hypothetical protein